MGVTIGDRIASSGAAATRARMIGDPAGRPLSRRALDVARIAVTRGQPLWVLALSGLLGFRVGFVAFPTWHVAVETAQVVAGIVQYPPDNPFYVYHTKLWTILHQIGALLLLGGASETALSLFLSGLLGMVSFQALAMAVYALSRNPLLAIGSAFLIFFSRAAEHGAVYPVYLMGTEHTYGALGLSAIALVAGLIGSGCYRLGAFLCGLVPAVHPSLGAWLWIALTPVVVWDVRRLRDECRGALPWLAAGCTVTVVSLLVHFAVTYDVPDVAPAVSARYLSAMVAFWDGHRQAVPLASSGVLLNGAALVVALTGLLAFPRRQVGPLLLLRLVAVSGAFSLAFGLLSWVPSDRLPQTLLILMPARLLNFNVLIFAAVVLGLLGRSREAGGTLLLAVSAAALLLQRDSMFWNRTGEPGPAIEMDRSDPRVLLVLAALVAISLVAVSRRGWTLSGARPDPPASSGGGSRATPATRAVQLAALGLMAWTAQQAWRLRAVPDLADRTNTPLFAVMAEEKEGLVATAGSMSLVQLATRRPVLINGGALDTLSYAPESGPAMAPILRDVYGIDLFNPPEGLTGGVAVIPYEYNRAVWEGYSLERWREIRRNYHVTQVLVRADYDLNLPVAAQFRWYRLYLIPD